VGGKEGGKLSPVAHLSQYFIVDTMLFWHANILVNYCVLVYENNFVMMNGEDKKDLASVKAYSRA
jgi:hypothetical protein